MTILVHALRRTDIHLLWLAPLPVLALCLAGGVWVEHAVLTLAVVAAAAGMLLPFWRRPLAGLAAGLLLAAVAALVVHLLGDDFHYRYVWTYSAAALPWHLKLANLWGGDEGTLLFMAALAALLGPWLARGNAWTEGGALAVVAAFAAAALLWSPFAPTAAEALAELPSRGMNAHLLSIWMAFHPPQVLAAYVILMLPAGAALQAVAGRGGGGPGEWGQVAPRAMRLAWLVLSLGLALGMWWAYEDFSFGQVWHWDPVQTSIFIVWALLTAQLHTLRRYRADGLFALVGPLLALLGAGFALISMAVTRSSTLASSHRYIGDTSGPLLLGFGLALFGATVAALLHRRSRHGGVARHGQHAHPMLLWLRIGIVILVAAAAVAGGHLAHAYASAFLEIPRPDYFKPYLEFMRQRAGPDEMAALLAAFEQWDVDGYVLAAHLLLPLAGFGLVGGWFFFRRISVVAGRLSLLLAVVAIGGNAAWGGVVTRSYAGEGILSQQIVAVLPWLDASLIGGAYLALGGIAWAAHVLRRQGRKAVASVVPLAAIHAGVALALWGGLLATALNSYTQHEIAFDGGPSAWATDRHGYALRLAEIRVGAANDGAGGAQSVVQALTTIEVRGPDGERLDGQTLYRDARALSERFDGPLRQVCELLDYRYARHVGTPGYLLQPLIDQGWGRSVQFWVSPAAVVGALDGSGGGPAIVVVKVFPFMSLLWIGLLLLLFGSTWLALSGARGVRRARRGAKS